jgi:DNA/RNA-binding domain of Phe-tRNA-synthetase-like protein
MVLLDTSQLTGIQYNQSSHNHHTGQHFMTYFQYHPEILQAFPSIVAGVLVFDVADNSTPDNPAQGVTAVRNLYKTEQEKLFTKYKDIAPSDIPALNAWRGAFRKFGVDPTQYRSACESLFRRLTKKGDVPFINTLVDIGNLISLRYSIPVAVLDRSALNGVLTVHFSDGTEIFNMLDDVEAEKHPQVGEVIFSDEAKQVMARRWCWRQSNESAARETTRQVLIVTEGHHENAPQDIQSAVNDMQALLTLSELLTTPVQTQILTANS